MAAIDNFPAYGTPSAAAPSLSLRRLFGWLGFRRPEYTAATPAPEARKRPAHEANYLADIGMEVGF